MTLREARQKHEELGGGMANFYINIDKNTLRAEVVEITECSILAEIDCDYVLSAKTVTYATCTASATALMEKQQRIGIFQRDVS